MDPMTPPQYVLHTARGKTSIPLLSNHHSDGTHSEFPMGFVRSCVSGEVALFMPAVHCGRTLRKNTVFTHMGVYATVQLAVLARQIALRRVASASLPIVYDGSYCLVVRDGEDGAAIAHPYWCKCCWCNVVLAVHAYLAVCTKLNFERLPCGNDVTATTRDLQSASSVVAECDAFWRHVSLT